MTNYGWSDRSLFTQAEILTNTTSDWQRNDSYEAANGESAQPASTEEIRGPLLKYHIPLTHSALSALDGYIAFLLKVNIEDQTRSGPEHCTCWQSVKHLLKAMVMMWALSMERMRWIVRGILIILITVIIMIIIIIVYISERRSNSHQFLPDWS